jgi:hypothetical protein
MPRGDLSKNLFPKPKEKTMSDTADEPTPEGTTVDPAPTEEETEERVKEVLSDEQDRLRSSDDDTQSDDASVEGDADESS